MKINKEKLIDVINQKWSTKTCPMCGRNNWSIDDDMMAMVSIGKDLSVQLGGKIIPVTAVICRECGNTVFVNPIVISCIED